jgi:Tfp pilus assembly protein PilO
VTAVDQSKALWSSMPGWGVVANLLPPEVIVARRVRALRKVIVFALALVLVLAAAGYGYAFWRARAASSALNAEQSRTTELQRQEDQYADVVRMQGTVASVKAQVATLLAKDVDIAQLINGVVAKLPAGATLAQLSLALSTGTTPGAGAPAVNTTNQATLDTSGRPHIGTINLTGQAHDLNQVAAFVSGLASVPGVVGVLPTSQQGNAASVQFTVQLTLTDQVLSHRYAAGGK